jgi:hypothetical protein
MLCTLFSEKFLMVCERNPTTMKHHTQQEITNSIGPEIDLVHFNLLQSLVFVKFGYSKSRDIILRFRRFDFSRLDLDVCWLIYF